MEGMNGWVGGIMKENINGAFGVSSGSKNGRELVYFFTEKGLYVENTYLKHKYMM